MTSGETFYGKSVYDMTKDAIEKKMLPADCQGCRNSFGWWIAGADGATPLCDDHGKWPEICK